MPIHLPESTPPLVNPAVIDEISVEILEHGITGMWEKTFPEFRDRQPILAPHIFECSFVDIEKGKPLADDRPSRVFRTGAVLAELAYVKSGFVLPLKDPRTFDTAYLHANMTGIPEAYELKGVSDSTLQDLVQLILETPEMRDGATLYGGYEKVLTMGVGFTRHYLQPLAA